MTIEIIKLDEYKKIVNENKIDLPIYMDISTLKFYKNLEIIKVCKGNKVVSLYAYPLFRTGKELWVKREYRFLPYSGPVFLYKYNILKRKKICYEIYKYLFNKYDVVYMPLFPNFENITAIQSLGGFIEERSTNVIRNRIDYKDLSSKLRNHINHAKKRVKIEITKNCDEFNYEKAIKGKQDEKQKRKKLARFLIKLKRGIIINAYEGETNIAGALVAYDTKRAYLLHTWQNADTIRGTISLVIMEAINWCFTNLNIETFDFEGSVIDSIDDFFTSFNTEIEMYPYIHYAKDKNNFINIVERSINIIGRIRNE